MTRTILFACLPWRAAARLPQMVSDCAEIFGRGSRPYIWQSLEAVGVTQVHFIWTHKIGCHGVQDLLSYRAAWEAFSPSRTMLHCKKVYRIRRHWGFGGLEGMTIKLRSSQSSPNLQCIYPTFDISLLWTSMTSTSRHSRICDVWSSLFLRSLPLMWSESLGLGYPITSEGYHPSLSLCVTYRESAAGKSRLTVKFSGSGSLLISRPAWNIRG